ncbi:hypothetical protein KTAU_39470 [Thermogemmatispora aurantia]|uniref:Uncharacterized protein n=1 Tax=Thermogemmatispora aurantia TaxID=2045279 RepID=A0A5J4KEF3_9CHLR|nr:hypothetical protein KTAU_39470 [Thermogemmatispora aurantia]
MRKYALPGRAELLPVAWSARQRSEGCTRELAGAALFSIGGVGPYWRLSFPY